MRSSLVLLGTVAGRPKASGYDLTCRFSNGNLTGSPSSCGHFAVGTFSETYLKDVVFEMSVFTQFKSSEMTKLKNVICDTKINICITFEY